MTMDNYLGTHGCKIIHEFAIRILTQVGIKLDHEEACDLLLSNGAREGRNKRMFIPAKLVDEALEMAQSRLQLFDRTGKPALSLEPDGKTYFGPGSDALYQIDLDSNQRRVARLDDVKKNARLIDSLKHIDFAMSMALPSDVSEQLYGHVFKTVTENTVKPIVATSTNMRDLEQIHKIAMIVTGGKEAFKKRPFYILYLEPISPLYSDRDGVDRLLYAAEHEIPFLYSPGANCGIAAPVTLEGALIQGTAEFLSGLVMAKLKNRNARLIYGANSSGNDPRTMKVKYGSPEWMKTVALYAEMGRFYHMPSWGTGGCSDAKAINAYALWEAQEGIDACLRAGISLAHDAGFFNYGFTYDPRMIVVIDEMVRRARFLREEVEVSKQRLKKAVEAIDDVCNGKGIFPCHDHTLKYFRECTYIPPSWAEEMKEQADGILEQLTEETRRRIAKHRSKPIHGDKLAAMKRVLEGSVYYSIQEDKNSIPA